jgi:hypothetical protein
MFSGLTSRWLMPSCSSWTLIEYVETGGNGNVWFVESNGEVAALKILHRLGDVDYERFKREVETCKRLDTDAIAILPILDDHCRRS